MHAVMWSVLTHCPPSDAFSSAVLVIHEFISSSPGTVYEWNRFFSSKTGNIGGGAWCCRRSHAQGELWITTTNKFWAYQGI